MSTTCTSHDKRPDAFTVSFGTFCLSRMSSHGVGSHTVWESDSTKSEANVLPALIHVIAQGGFLPIEGEPDTVLLRRGFSTKGAPQHHYPFWIPVLTIAVDGKITAL